jgi:hypothetical protein
MMARNRYVFSWSPEEAVILGLIAFFMLLLVFGCSKDSTAPTFGTVRVVVGSTCASNEDVQVWVEGTNGSDGRTTIYYPTPLDITNVPTGFRSVDIFRWRYSTEGNLHVTVKTGAVTSVRLDCPDGYTITEP